MERFFLVLAAVVIFVAVFSSPFLLSWSFGMFKRIMTDGKTRKLLRSWGINTYNYSSSWQPMVYFLSSGGKILRLSLLEFHRLRMPKSEMPEWWITRIGVHPEKYDSADKLHLIHKGGHSDDANQWHFFYSGITEEESHLKLYLHDRDGKTALVRVTADKGCEGLFAKILEAVSTYSDVNDAWIQTVQKEGAAVLLETKGTMGKSPKIEALRYVLENGTSGIFKFGESILPEAFLNAA